MNQQTKVISTKPNEIKIGLVGFSGSGKTTFQAAFAYLLYNRTDKDLKHGEPIGLGTRNYINPKIKDLIAGTFPEEGSPEIQLTYRLNYKGADYLLNIIDYDGCLTDKVHSEDSDEQDLSGIRSFLEKCDAYFILIPADDLIMDANDAPIDKYGSMYDIISYYKTQGKKLKKPMLFLVTKTDRININDEKVISQINNSLKQFEIRLKDYANYLDKFFVSTIGRNFLDSENRKLNKAELNPENIFEPIKKVLNYQLRKKRSKRNLKVLEVALVFILALFSLTFYGFHTSNKKFSEFENLAWDIDLLDEDNLEILLGEVNEAYKELGWQLFFVPKDADSIKQNIVYSILSKLDVKYFNKIMDFAEVFKVFSEEPSQDNFENSAFIRGLNPSSWVEKLTELQSLVDAYEQKYKNKNYQKKFSARLQAVFAQNQKLFDDAMWAKAITENSIDSYADYISVCKSFGANIEAAISKISILKKQNIEMKWHYIEEYIADNPKDYEGIIRRIRNFIRIHPREVYIENNPNELLENIIQQWNEEEYAKLERFFKTKVDVNNGKINDVLEYEKKCQEYLKTFSFKTPLHKEKIEKIIPVLSQISTSQTYKLTMLKAEITGTFKEEDDPDVFIKIFINDKIVYNSREHTKTDDRNPIWNIDIEITWQAYDKIQVEIWDANPFYRKDHHYCNIVRRSLFSADDAFKNTIYQTDTGKIEFFFNWQGPKRE